MKEIKRGIEQAFLSVPESFRDWLTIRVTEYGLQFGAGHSFRTNKGRWWGRKIMDNWLYGAPTPLSEFAEGLFDGFNFNYEGIENLPTGGAEIIVVNYPATGPLRGNWFKFLTNLAIAQRRGFTGNFEARWVQKEVSEKLIFQNTPVGIQRRRLARMINKSCGTILVGPTVSGRENIKAVLEMRKHIVSGGVLIICPEGKDRSVLGRGKMEAGDLLLFLTKKTGVQIRPVAAWSEDEDLNIRFGETINLNFSSITGQKMADLAMVSVARLMPQEKMGIYKKLAVTRG